MSGIALKIDDNLSVLHTFGDVKYIQNKQSKNNSEKFPSGLNLDDITRKINNNFNTNTVNKIKYEKENLIVACKVEDFDSVAFIPFGRKLEIKKQQVFSGPNLKITTKYLFNPMYYKKFIPSLKNEETVNKINFFKEIRDDDPIVGLFEVTIDSTKKYLLLFKEDYELKSTGTQHEINGLENYNNFPFLVKKNTDCSIWTKRNNIAGVYIMESDNFKKEVKERIDKVYNNAYTENFKIDMLFI